MLLLLGLAGASAQVSAGAADTWDIPTWLDMSVDEVVGGEPVKKGAWEDTVGIVFDYGQFEYVGCTGTLIDGKVVLTAGHCVVGASISSVLTANTDWAQDRGGELIEVDGVFEHPDSQYTYDVGVLTLAKKSEVAPRAVAIDCIVDEYLVDGADVTVVGYGVTDEDGYDYNTKKNEGDTVVQDADCGKDFIDGMFTGCNPSVRPGGEIAAGGNGVDACFGDSGGPLYLRTPKGDFVTGVVSRAYAGVDPRLPCIDGGIYVRVDAVIDWIEDTVGHDVTWPSCNDAPSLTHGVLETKRDTVGTLQLVVEDPDGDASKAVFAIVTEPANGAAEVDGDGLLTYTPDPGFEGDDTVVVSVTDEGRKPYKTRSGAALTTEAEIAVTVAPGGVFGGIGGGDGESQPACACQTGPTGGALASLGLLPLWRRRRRA